MTLANRSEAFSSPAITAPRTSGLRPNSSCRPDAFRRPGTAASAGPRGFGRCPASSHWRGSQSRGEQLPQRAGAGKERVQRPFAPGWGQVLHRIAEYRASALQTGVVQAHACVRCGNAHTSAGDDLATAARMGIAQARQASASARGVHRRLDVVRCRQRRWRSAPSTRSY
jgi:hypothetical protein